MSYRKLEVNGQVFEYSIGRTHTKIRGVGAYKNEDVGNEYTSGTCHCGSPCCDYAAPTDIQVRPSDLASFIKLNKLKVKSEDKRRKV
jgi:hypothetical protein